MYISFSTWEPACAPSVSTKLWWVLFLCRCWVNWRRWGPVLGILMPVRHDSPSLTWSGRRRLRIRSSQLTFVKQKLVTAYRMVLIFHGSNFSWIAVFWNFVKIISRTRTLLIYRTVAVKSFAEINFANDSKFAKLKTREIKALYGTPYSLIALKFRRQSVCF